MSSPFERIAKSIFGRLLTEGINRILKGARKGEPPQSTEPQQPEPPKNHPWRLCPIGESWVRTHPLTVPGRSKKPEYKTVRNGFCRANPGAREIYTANELQEIAELHFKSLADDPDAMPAPDAMGFPDGNSYDPLIAGWTKFWNEILRPDELLTPDFVKALIATESSFRILPDTKSKEGAVTGLIQVTEKTRKILGKDPKKELRDHLVDMSIEESRKAGINIAAGVRWLHHKRNLLRKRLKRKVTWEEAAWEYKGIFKDVDGKNKKVRRILTDLKGYHQRLKDARAKFPGSRRPP